MSNVVNVDFVTKVVEIQVNDTPEESLAAQAAINAAARAAEIADDAEIELDSYTEAKMTEIAILGQGYVDSASEKADEANTILTAIRNEYGYPFVASTAADMTDTTKIYVYTGNETGYTNGNWYYHDGTDWVSGGVYNAVAFETDPTLAIRGAAADANMTGAIAFASLKTSFDYLGKIEEENIVVPPGSTKKTLTKINFTKDKPVVIDIDFASATPYNTYFYVADANGNTLLPGGSSSILIAQGSTTFTRTITPSQNYEDAVVQMTLSSSSLSDITIEKMILTQEDNPFSEIQNTANYASNSIDLLYDGQQNIKIVENKGFIGSDGNINGQTSNNEYYTNQISVSQGESYTVELKYTNIGDAVWLAVATYDSTDTFVSRIVLDNTSTTSTKVTYTVPAGVSYIAFTYYTHDGADVLIYKPLQYVVDNEENKKIIASMTSTSRNLFDADTFVWSQASYNNSGMQPSTGDTSACIPPIIPVEGGEAYSFSWGTADATYMYIQEFNALGTRVTSTRVSFAPHKASIVLNANTTTVGLMSYKSPNTDWQKLIPTYMQVEKNAEVTEYVPHNIVATSRIDFLNLSSALNNYLLDSYALPSMTVRNIAHRGDDLIAPQNTAPAYIVAKKRGFTVAENDLFYSNDGVLVMWHDTTLTRLGNLVDINGYLMYTDGANYYWVDPDTNDVYTWDGTDYVASAVDIDTLTRCAGANYSVNNMSAPTTTGLDFDILRRIDFGVYKGLQYKGTQILTFAEWILLCKQLGMGALVDRKLTYTDAIVTEVANTVKRLGMGEYTSFVGLTGSQINLLRTIIPHARCGVVSHPTAESVVTYAPYNVDGKFFFDGDANTLTPEIAQIGINAGFEVETWCVEYGSKTEEEIFAIIRNAVECGVTGITLDHYRTNDAFAYLLE